MKLILENLTKEYGNNLVLDDINFEFEQGKIYGLIGRNGAGKTTLFNCLNEDIDKTSGEAYLEKEIKFPIHSNDIGYVIATPKVPEFLTGREFLQFFLDINKDKIENIKTIDEYFDMVKLDKADQDKLMKDYSHGMKNKMQMLINFIDNKDVLLLDEPLTALDVVVSEEMKKLLKSIKKDHIIIFSTHILKLALSLCDEIVIINNKKLELVSKDNLNTAKYKNKIINALKDDNNA